MAWKLMNCAGTSGCHCDLDFWPESEPLSNYSKSSDALLTNEYGYSYSSPCIELSYFHTGEHYRELLLPADGLQTAYGLGDVRIGMVGLGNDVEMLR